MESSYPQAIKTIEYDWNGLKARVASKNLYLRLHAELNSITLYNDYQQESNKLKEFLSKVEEVALLHALVEEIAFDWYYLKYLVYIHEENYNRLLNPVSFQVINDRLNEVRDRDKEDYPVPASLGGHHFY